MTDMICSVCMEPWDAYGARHGDMQKWEYELFRKGAGCPHCEGRSEHPEALEAALRQQIFEPTDDDDVAHGLMDLAMGGERPKWERPADETLFECSACKTRYVRDAEGELSHDAPRIRQWHSVPRGMLTDVSDFLAVGCKDTKYFIGGHQFCPICVTECGECSKPVFRSGEDQGDPEDPGSAVPHPHDYSACVCYECFSSMDSE